MRMIMRTVQTHEPVSNPDYLVQLRLDGSEIRLRDIMGGKFWDDMNKLNKFAYRRFYGK